LTISVPQAYHFPVRSGGRFISLICGLAFAFATFATPAGAKPILLPTVKLEVKLQRTLLLKRLLGPGLTPPPLPCPENGLLPSPLGNCGLPELPATTLPWPGNMAYYGGHVQLRPKVYLVYWGWGEPGAWPQGTSCRSLRIGYGAVTGKLACDPDGAGARMADFVSQMGGTRWAGVQTQYFQRRGERRQFITNPKHQLAGLWADDVDDASGLSKTSAENPAGSANTYTDLAREGERAMKHFGLRRLANADIVIAQPPRFSDPNAISQGYCAFHDYTEPRLEKGIYDGIAPGIAYINMPYQLAINSNGANLCGENFVNPGATGKLDGFSIVLGHEIEETVTDPGAEDILGGAGLGNQTFLGGWYDTIDGDENGDKCAWVGTLLDGGGSPNVMPIPGAVGNIRGNRGTIFPVQSLWSNRAALGLGYCVGSGAG
jgi:hypothetical protein